MNTVSEQKSGLSSNKSGLIKTAVALAGFSLAGATLPKSDAALIQDGQSFQPLIEYGSKFAASNGGPAVTMVISSPDFASLPSNGIIFNGELVVSGTLGPRDSNGQITIWGGSHTVLYNGTSPDRITGIRVYTGTNWLSDPGLTLQVDLASLRLAPGANGTLNSFDYFGAKLLGDIPGLGEFDFSPAPVGTQVIHAGTGFAATVTEAATGTFAPRSFQMMAWNAIVNSSSPAGTNDQFLNGSAFGYNLPPDGKNAKLLGGDSNGPVINFDSIQWTQDGRIDSLTLAGVGIGQSGNALDFGSNVYVDSGTEAAQGFQNSFVVPEPTTTSLIVGSLGLSLMLRRRYNRSQSLE